MKQTQKTQLTPLLVAPNQVIKGEKILKEAVKAIAPLGERALILGGENTQSLIASEIEPLLKQFHPVTAQYTPDCSEASLQTLRAIVTEAAIDLVIGVGGGKALDTAKLLADQCKLPVVTIPTSGATCAAWTALANVYTDGGTFQYDVPLAQSPNLLILDYHLLKTAPQRTLVAGIGDALAKWYEASVSSGTSTATLTIAAVQQARILRDILLQKSLGALQDPGGEDWKEVVDATVLLAGVIGGLGGANCRTVAAHAVHNGLTHLHSDSTTLHGEKVAYGILVQLRLEEMLQNNQLALSAREQLLQFYSKIGLPQTLGDLGLENITLAQLRTCAEVICQPNSDIHRLPFSVTPDQLMAAMVSTKVKVKV